MFTAIKIAIYIYIPVKDLGMIKAFDYFSKCNELQEIARVYMGSNLLPVSIFLFLFILTGQVSKDLIWKRKYSRLKIMRKN